MMIDSKKTDIVVTCPCCNARLQIDSTLHKVVSHEAPPKATNAPDLDRAAALLKEQAARREALFKQSTENEKIKSQLLERKFEAALEKSKDEPVKKPTRDIDL
jgi:hypothetical protein